MTMNLIVDPWIPALRSDGRRQLFSLEELFAQADTLRDLAVLPHERIAVMRLLLCITQAALDGPADEETWQECRLQIQPSVRKYLERWRPAFELFGKGPRFLQVSNLQPGKSSDPGSAATKLDLALATGNTSTLFDNLAADERVLDSARTAINLLTFQCFSPCGRIGIAKWDGRETPGNGSSNHAPCCPSSMVHGIILGSTLLESLHLNLLTRQVAEDVYGPQGWGHPSWECPVAHAEDAAPVANAVRTYLGRLAPLSRAIRLNDDGSSIILANGLDYPSFPEFREATSTIVKRKEELGVLPASTSRSLWRQLAAVSVRRRSGADATAGPLALGHVTDDTVTTLWVGAMVTDKAKIKDVVESSYALPGGMFSEFGRAAYEAGVAAAEEREGALIQGVKTYASDLKLGSPPYDRARHDFWTRVEQGLGSLFELARNPNLVADLLNCAWGKTIQSAALDSYARSCPHQTPRQLQAYSLGLRRLAIRRQSKTQPTLTTP